MLHAGATSGVQDGAIALVYGLHRESRERPDVDHN
jgi:hypothetical protein